MKEEKETSLDRILKRIEEQENDLEYQEKHKYVRPSLEYQIGWYIGEFIHSNLLPTLSIDMLKTRKVIDVTEEETKKFEELDEKWHKEWEKTRESKGNEKEWKELQEFRKELEKKYLPEKLKCLVPKFDVDDIEELKKGIRECLWDTDLSHYECGSNKDIEIEEIDTTDRSYQWVWCRTVTLTRG